MVFKIERNEASKRDARRNREGFVGEEEVTLHHEEEIAEVLGHGETWPAKKRRRLGADRGWPCEALIYRISPKRGWIRGGAAAVEAHGCGGWPGYARSARGESNGLDVGLPAVDGCAAMGEIRMGFS